MVISPAAHYATPPISPPGPEHHPAGLGVIDLALSIVSVHGMTRFSRDRILVPIDGVIFIMRNGISGRWCWSAKSYTAPAATKAR